MCGGIVKEFLLRRTKIFRKVRGIFVNAPFTALTDDSFVALSGGMTFADPSAGHAARLTVGGARMLNFGGGALETLKTGLE